MPYKSKAQQRKFHADPKLRKLAPEWDAATKKAGGFARLPQRKGKRMAKGKVAGFAGRKPPSVGKKGKSTNMKKTASGGAVASQKRPTGLSGATGRKPPAKVGGKIKKGAGPKGKKAKGYSQ